MTDATLPNNPKKTTSSGVTQREVPTAEGAGASNGNEAPAA